MDITAEREAAQKTLQQAQEQIAAWSRTAERQIGVLEFLKKMEDEVAVEPEPKANGKSKGLGLPAHD